MRRLNWFGVKVSFFLFCIVFCEHWSLANDIVHLADGTHLTVFVLAPVNNVEQEARVQDLIY